MTAARAYARRVANAKHCDRGAAIDGAAIAESTVCTRAPALHATAGEQRAAVKTARRYRGGRGDAADGDPGAAIDGAKKDDFNATAEVRKRQPAAP